MRVLERLDRDVICYGFAQAVVTNRTDKYSIRRIHPHASSVEIRQIMDIENDYQG